ncbi:MAG: hypothetical protein A2167_05980 [Planctomycetes bacterium RBG_13_46_10]|nr:MAG: hypothetical protein A2167_05980 [Planctomycetes bacterium RBG_13_46_10]
MKKLPTLCPACQSQLSIKKLSCTKCNTEIEGSFALPGLLRLSVDDQEFILQFVKCSGSLKEIARRLKLSYPTVRNRIDDIINQIKSLENQD